MLPCVHYSIIHVGQDTEATKVSFNDYWIRKMYLYAMEYYSGITKDEVLPFAITWIDLENIMLSEITQADKSKNHMISFMFGIYN